MLCHLQLNNPLWPEARPTDMYLFAVVAIVVAWINRETMFQRGGGVTKSFLMKDEAHRACGPCVA